MIRVVVVDDDFRVARIHAASVDRVDGFRCVGHAQTAADARHVIAELRPDLMLLDIYLPDEDGLSLLRSLHAGPDPAPDCIVASAARDMQRIRSAMQVGVLYYLVKPFAFAQLRTHLEIYRRWRAGVEASASQADQATVDGLYHLLRDPGAPSGPRGSLTPTMQAILEVIRAAERPLGAAQVARELGMSRPTAQRYLARLDSLGLVELRLTYGSTGRPNHYYRPAGPAPG